MKVFAFDLLPYPENLDHLKQGGPELPYPLPKRHFNPKVAVRNYEEHLEAWVFMEDLGFDGVGFNEHHTSPYGLMTSPNLMAAAASQRTKRIKLLILGNLLPIHEPLRLAEELAMLDCMSNGRLIAGFARGIPREYNVYGVSLSESRERFEEAWEIIKLVWMEESFSYEGKFWTYHDVAIWPRPLQQPHPPVRVPVTSSQETIEWAARENIAINPGGQTPGVSQDIVRYYAECLKKNGYQSTPDHITVGSSVHVADSREQAIEEAAPYTLYFNRTLFSHGNVYDRTLQQQAGYGTGVYDYLRPENRELMSRPPTFRNMTIEDIERNERLPWGTPEEVIERLISLADVMGAGTLQLNFNQGAMPHKMFMQQLERFGKDVLPALHAHEPASLPVG